MDKPGGRCPPYNVYQPVDTGFRRYGEGKYPALGLLRVLRNLAMTMGMDKPGGRCLPYSVYQPVDTVPLLRMLRKVYITS